MSEELKGENKKYENSLAEVPENQIEKDEIKSAKNQETIQYMIIIKNTIENLELGVRCEFDNPENPSTILIYDKDNKFVTAITKENGLDANVSDLANKIARLLDASYKEFPEGVQKLLQGAGNQKYLNGKELLELDGEELQKLNGKTGFEMLSDEEKLALQGKVKIEPDEKNLHQKEEAETNQIEDDLKQSTGDEYEIIGKIRESGQGNSFILSKIHETQGIIGSVYKVRNKTTGEYTLAGKESGKDGKIKVVNYKRYSMNLKQNSEHIVGGNSVTEKQHEHANDLMDIGDGISLEITEHELNAVFKNQDGKNDGFKIETDPVSGKSTTEEIEEVKLNHEKVAEVRNLIDQLNGIDNAEKESRFKAIMNDGKSIDENIAELKEEIENQDKQEKEQKDDFDESQYDPRDPYFQMEQRLRRERDINN